MTNESHCYAQEISNSGYSIYDFIKIGDPKLWIPSNELELLLVNGLQGFSLQGLPLRTRSKVVKQKVCQTLGYPTPKSFKKTQPRFPGQLLDIYIQKSNNLQIWNEEISSSRRYAIIQVSPTDIITNVKIVTGNILSAFDTTGTLTQKYQAKIERGTAPTELITSVDTNNLNLIFSQRGISSQISFRERPAIYHTVSPISSPTPDTLMTIADIFTMLSSLVGQSFDAIGSDQERKRSTELHHLVCRTLGYNGYKDDGQFPDIRNQLLEIKLQTSPTIDLGLVKPDSIEPLDIPALDSCIVLHCDVRYAIFGAKTDGQQVTITNLYLSTGELFFTRFPQFQGKVLNKKLQIPLPNNFFD